jgi:hypothetical protein
MKKPIFSRKEVIVEMPEDNSLGMAVRECASTVVYVGKEVNPENYKVGDTVLFYRGIGSEIKYFDKPLWRIENEIQVLCKIVED